MHRRMRGCFVSILRRRASSDFESKYEWPQGIVGDWQGGEVSMKRPRVVIPWFGLVVCWLNNGWCGRVGGTFLIWCLSEGNLLFKVGIVSNLCRKGIKFWDEMVLSPYVWLYSEFKSETEFLVKILERDGFVAICMII